MRSAEELKEYLLEQARNRDGDHPDPITDKQVMFMNAGLTRAGNNRKRKAFLKYVFDSTSSKGLTRGEAGAVIDWLEANKENGYQPPHSVTIELERVYVAVLIDEGQMPLL